MIISLVFVGYLVWSLVIKKARYPEGFPVLLKWLNALNLFFVMSQSWLGLDGLWWLLRNPNQIVKCLAGEENHLGSQLVGLALIINLITAVSTLWICCEMALQKIRALKFYYISWPIYLVSSVYYSYNCYYQLNNPTPMEPFLIFLTLGFILTLGFYCPRKIRYGLFNQTVE